MKEPLKGTFKGTLKETPQSRIDDFSKLGAPAWLFFALSRAALANLISSARDWVTILG